jgi:ribosomal protein L2
MALRVGSSVLQDVKLLTSQLSRFYITPRRYASTSSQATNNSTSTVSVAAAMAVGKEEGEKPKRQQSATMRTYKPRTPGVRHLRRPINDHLWKGRPYLPLTYPKIGHGKGGRNNQGRITVRHRGGGVRRRIRTVDFFRWDGGAHVVDRIEYDPNRSAHLALLTHKSTQKKSYIIAPDGMEPGDVVHSYRSGIPRPMLDSMGGVIDPGVLASKTCFRGNCLPVSLIPLGTLIHNIGSRVRGPAVFCRSAGTYAVIVSKGEEVQEDGTKVMTDEAIAIRLQSGEVRTVSKDACATIGVVSNPNHHLRQLGKAGRSRWLNIRPSVRGVAMNRGMPGERSDRRFCCARAMLTGLQLYS